MFRTWYESLLIILGQSLDELAIFLPRILAALIIFIIGAALARALRRVVVGLLGTMRISALIEKTPVEHFLKNADMSHKLEEIIGSLLYWLVMLIVLQTSVSVVGLTSLSEILNRILSYIPHIFSAVLVLFFGVLLAGLVESLVKGSIKSIDGKSSRLLGKISSYLVVTIAIMAAVSELGIASEFIMILFVGFITTLSLGVGLALGLGGKDVVAKVLNKWYDSTLKEIAE